MLAGTMKRILAIKYGKPILTPAVVEKIVDCLKPSIRALLEMYERPFLHAIILDPIDGKTVLYDGPLNRTVKEYPRPYHEVAMKKAIVSARTGMDTSEVHAYAAFLLTEGDVIYSQGGVNCEGLVVATSGAPGPVDEAVSRMIAGHLLAYCQVQLQKLQAESPKSGSFLIPKS
jgi:hypothetical protein